MLADLAPAYYLVPLNLHDCLRVMIAKQVQNPGKEHFYVFHTTLQYY